VEAHLGFGLFVLPQVIFAIDPIGRRFGRQLNDAAMRHDRAERERS
jgi:hypothetical protein